ncbi:MAG: hypothetical protein GKR86_14105, partial [Ilumatobacter sp.]|nr:hypothetical protein [Ilumatobacter sp.]
RMRFSSNTILPVPMQISASWASWSVLLRKWTSLAATGLRPNSPKLKAIDLQYHDMRLDRCLALRAGLETLVDSDTAVAAKSQPPTSTRAYFRGRCLDKFAADVVAANWDSLVFDIGRDPLRRVPMMDPLRGTADQVATLIDESDTARILLDRLGETN